MILSHQSLARLIRGQVPAIYAEGPPISNGQIQPSSIDLRFGEEVVAIESSVVSGNDMLVEDIIKRMKRYDFALSPDKPNLLEKERTYLIKLREGCALPEHLYLEFSPKSSAGRADVFVRVISNNFSHFDVTAPGYHGPLYAIVTPLSFDVLVNDGLSLVQARVKHVGARQVVGKMLTEMHTEFGLMFDAAGVPLTQKQLHIRNDELYYHLDLSREIVGFAALHTVSEPLDLTVTKKEDLHDPMDFWLPLRRPKDGTLTIVPGTFYLLATKERVSIPQGFCAQMNSYDTTSGEYRSHYAGFFDPGFGSKGGTAGVLEVRANTVNFLLRDGHPVCSMRFEKLDEPSDVLYEGHYVNAGPSVGKHFKDRNDVWTRAYWAKRWSE